MITNEPLVQRSASKEDIKWTRGMTIGTGAYSTVYSIYKENNSTKYAAKVANLKQLLNCNKLSDEIDLHKDLKHPNIVAYIADFQTTFHVISVMEYCEGGDLFTRHKTRGKLTEIEIKLIFPQVLRGLSYLHSVGIVHRDVKPANILLSTLNIHKSTVAKICDFGFSVYVGLETCLEEIGSPNYLAPEMIGGKDKYVKNRSLYQTRRGIKLSKKDMEGDVIYDLAEFEAYTTRCYKIDIWSLAATMFYTLTGIAPFENIDKPKTFKRILNIEYKWPNNILISDELKALISYMFTLNPDLRPSATDLLVHSYFIDLL